MIKNRLKIVTMILIVSTGVAYGGESMKKLEKCPSSPNCVVSLEEERENSYHIEPILFGEKNSQEVERNLVEIISKLGGKISEESEGYIRAEFHSKIFKFKDVAEFVIVSEEKKIMVRSEAQTGWSDFGVNRKRMEKIRLELSKN